MVDTTKITAFVNALNAKFENKQANKKSDISGDFSDDTISYPTVQAVKSWVENQINNIGSVILGETSDTAYRGDRGKAAYDHSQLTTGNPHNVTKTDVGLSNVTNVAQAPATHVGDDTHLTSAQKTAINSISGKANISDLTAKEDIVNKVSNWNSTTTNVNYPSEKLVKDSLDNKVDKVNGKGLSTNDFTNTYKTALDNLNTNLSGKDVTVEKLGTAESGYIASYVVKQNGSQVGATINIPKDYLVKSATVGTVTTVNDPVTGYVVGDRYIDFIINTKDNSGTNEHLYILVSDLVDEYFADESTLTLSGNTFSVKNGGITLTKLASSVQTSLGYADAWNSSPAKGITAAQITSWDTAIAGGLTINDVDSEIEAYLTALTIALTPSYTGQMVYNYSDYEGEDEPYTITVDPQLYNNPIHMYVMDLRSVSTANQFTTAEYNAKSLAYIQSATYAYDDWNYSVTIDDSTLDNDVMDSDIYGWTPTSTYPTCYGSKWVRDNEDMMIYDSLDSGMSGSSSFFLLIAWDDNGNPLDIEYTATDSMHMTATIKPHTT